MVNEEVGVLTLKQLKKALDSVKMQFWITDGTLLGYYRDNGFILHDSDIDVATCITDLSPDIFKSLELHGLEIVHIFGTVECGFEISVILKQEFIPNGGYPVKCDIFFFYDGPGNTIWHAAWDGPVKGTSNLCRMFSYSYEKFKLKKVTFKGEQFFAPADIEKFLVTKYGPHWRTPDANWDWRYSPVNSKKTSVYAPHQYSLFNKEI